ncbi:adenylosuccinate synthetase [Oryzifoliimicrobium ureilyticus]|uniref:adenylosuccinate synthetase n=1 Tax=Oryzifoliimicrobium ureilyticus TaxID=3113724 RepID=UPI003076407D
MSTTYAVIGANWGDEGKGLAVDAIASQLLQRGKKATVVRANGGAQAGHSVVCRTYGRHVFHHVGAGAFAGAGTHLSQFFVAHPMMLHRELAQLAASGLNAPSISIDARALVTTPWDMAINQALELARDAGRHGSTGLGFGETIERSERGPVLTAEDLWSDELAHKVETIVGEWMPQRLMELGITADGSALGKVLSGAPAVIEAFCIDCQRFRSSVRLMQDADLSDADAIIFEGAQGLQLDMKWGVMPHVTRSRTGLANIAAVAREAGIFTIEAFYMTRAYATRHGAGPLLHESKAGKEMPWLALRDETNIPNPWQGSLRTAPLDLSLMRKVIGQDLAEQADSSVKVNAYVGVTCLDQISDMAHCIFDESVQKIKPANLADLLQDHLGLPVALRSWGPSRADAQFHQRAAA